MDRLETEERLFTCIRRLMESEEGRRSMDLSHGELFLLWSIHRRSGTALPGELSREMHVSSARIARLLNTLEHRGFILRSIDRADRRRILVALTPAGKAHVEAVYKRIQRRISAIVDALGEEDTAEFLRLADRIISVSVALTQTETGGSIA